MSRLRLERQVAPEWDAIKAEWDVSMRFLLDHGVGGDLAYALAMVAQELLENAVKYGSFSAGQRILLVIDVQPHEALVEVKSPASVDPDALQQLDATIQWIRGFQSPFEAWVERLKQVGEQAFDPAKSGLGLARIAYEARCVLDFYVDETDTLSISAVYQSPEVALVP